MDCGTTGHAPDRARVEICSVSSMGFFGQIKGHRSDRTQTHGYAATREAQAAIRKAAPWLQA
jgi:hypothetical protein